MRCLITGGAGFIGSHLVDRLLGEGHEVTVLDNFSTGSPENLSLHRGNRALNVMDMDISSNSGVIDPFEGIHTVFHLSALADIVPSIVSPMGYYTSNVTGTVNVLEASRLAGVKRFIYAASSSCYGIPDMYPTPETADIRPQYPYALTKYLAEMCVIHWGQVYKLPVISLRLFNVYGPRARTSGAYGAVFGVFLAQKLAGKPFTVVGDGTQKRDFVYVSDVVDAFMLSAESPLSGEIMNVGSGRPRSVLYLTELLGGKVIHIPKRPGEPDCTHADIGKIHNLLGWKPKVSFQEGVKDMLEHINHWRSAPVWTPETIADATKEWFQYLK